MCGICGIFTPGGQAGTDNYRGYVEWMAGKMARRGPDDVGLWRSEDGQATFGFRRLSILDLSLAAHQPMVSGDGRSVLVFNGEVYNFRELRSELQQQGVGFRSNADSEVVLEALNCWGEEAVSRFNGMFALGWYHRERRELLLARDHAGIKPLYYALDPTGKQIVFGSQYNVITHTPWGVPGAVREDVLHLYLRLHHIPPPYGLLENTYQLEPGCLLKVIPDGSWQISRWWQLPRSPEISLRGREAMEELGEALDDTISRQRVADVPLGVFLSGGIDSPLVTAALQKQVGPALKAFTIGSPGWAQDESEDATGYAQQIGVVHRLHYVTPDEALAAVEDVIEAQHEPFGDFSILPTLLVSRLASEEITVALSGDGGDELFFGYQRPFSLLRGGETFRWPWPVRAGLYAAGKLGLAARRSEAVLARDPGDYYYNVNCRMQEADLARILPGLASAPDDLRLYAFSGKTDRVSLANYSRWVEYYGQMQRCLKKVDMASMHHSLEVRVPLLDRAVIDISLKIDPFSCMRDGLGKVVLRDLLAKYTPSARQTSAKRGFSVPLGEWLRGSLRELVEDTLFSGSLYPQGMFDPQALKQYWSEHREGKRDLKWAIWTILSLQWWANRHLKPGSNDW